jgi:hypothetical protein
MGRIGKKNEPSRKAGHRPAESSPAPVSPNDAPQDDVDDGDIATPKHNDDGEDDQPL